MHFISFSKKASIYEESQPFSSGWKCCPQAAIVTWNKDASLLQKRPQGLLFIHVFIFFVMYTQISIVKKSCVIPKGCAFQEMNIFFRTEIKLQHLGEERRNLTRKALRYRKELDRVRSWFLLYFFLFISSPFRCLFPSSPPSLSPKICWFSASFLTLSHNPAIFLHTIQNIHLYPHF